jgi:hypothetical protein
VVGLCLGATAASHGPFLPIDDWLTTTATRLPASLDAAVALPRWPMIVGLIGLIALGLLGRLRTERPDAWPWPITGLALGGVGLLAWVSGSIAGWGWGLSITGPSRSLIESTILGMPGAAGWGTALLVGIPLGTWVSARARGRVSWRSPGGAELGRRFAGGVLMGVGGTLAAGCNIGNALTGLSVLAVNSVIATAAIVAGAAVAIAGPGIRRTVPGLHLTRGQR